MNPVIIKFQCLKTSSFNSINSLLPQESKEKDFAQLTKTNLKRAKYNIYNRDIYDYKLSVQLMFTKIWEQPLQRGKYTWPTKTALFGKIQFML